MQWTSDGTEMPLAWLFSFVLICSWSISLPLSLVSSVVAGVRVVG